MTKLFFCRNRNIQILINDHNNKKLLGEIRTENKERFYNVRNKKAFLMKGNSLIRNIVYHQAKTEVVNKEN